VKSGGELAVEGRPQNLGSSVRQRRVKLWPCEARKFTYAVKSNGCVDPFVPQSWRLFQVWDPFRMIGVPVASLK
jgi:hypothetical protein